MSKDAFALKYRPKKIADLVGQDHVRQILTNSIKNNKYHHAYIFAGKFGSGKTSAARIFAASLNDPKGASLEPDLESDIVKKIFTGKHPDVIELDAATTRSIDDIRDIKQAIRYNPIECRKRFVIIDECLEGHCKISTDIGNIPISTIVSNRLKPLVKSYNHDTGKIEFRPITNWFKNSGKTVYSVSFEGAGNICCSDGHLFATPNGYKALRELQEGDVVYRSGRQLSYIEKQVILGSLLGDMSIQRNKSQSLRFKDSDKCRCRIKMVHGESQFDYIDFKRNLFQSVDFNKRDFLHSGFDGYDPKPMRTYVSRTSAAFSSVYDLVIKKTDSKSKKKVSREWLDCLDDMGLAIWYMDDGSIGIRKLKDGSVSCSISLHTSGFTNKENQIIADWLLAKGYKVSVVSAGSKKEIWKIDLSSESSMKFATAIAPYVPESMRYKLPPGMPAFQPELYECDEVIESVVEEKILKIEESGYRGVTYDIEVEGNHNYFANGTLVHNCHRLTGAAAEAALKMIEEPPENCIFILCTTDADKLKDTIHSRCLALRFNKIAWNLIFQHLKMVADAEGLEYDEKALKIAARKSKGSLRNALQNLQMLVTFAGGEPITAEIGKNALFAIDETHYFELVDAIIKPDAGDAMRIIDAMISDGREVGEVLDGLVGHIRNLLIIKTCPSTKGLLYLTDDEKKRYVHQLNAIPGNDKAQLLVEMFEYITEASRGIALNLNPQTMFEAFVVRSIIQSQTHRRMAQ